MSREKEEADFRIDPYIRKMNRAWRKNSSRLTGSSLGAAMIKDGD